MRLLVDGLSVHFGGGAHLLAGAVGELRRLDTPPEMRVLVGRWGAPLMAEAAGPSMRTVRVPDGAARHAWQQAVLPFDRWPDVVYCPGNIAPLAARHRVTARWPVVVGLQNPNMVGAGTLLPHNRRWNRRARVWATDRSLDLAAAVVAVSQAIADEACAHRPSLAGRVRVVRPGPPLIPATSRRPSGLPIGAEDLDFVVVVANDAPHKRLDETVAAWSAAASAGGRTGEIPALVLAGSLAPQRRLAQIAAVPNKARDRLVHLGPVTDRAEVRWLLEKARALLAPAVLESHNFTVVEAGALGCPVVASDIPVHREVAPEGTVFVPATDHDAWVAAIEGLRADPVRTPHAWPFSWAEHASELMAVLTAAQDGRRARSRV